VVYPASGFFGLGKTQETVAAQALLALSPEFASEAKTGFFANWAPNAGIIGVSLVSLRNNLSTLATIRAKIAPVTRRVR
jgi:hypothetical protein